MHIPVTEREGKEMAAWGGSMVSQSHNRELVPSKHAGESEFLLVLSVEEMRGMGTTGECEKSHFLLPQHLPLIFPIKRHWQWDIFLVTAYGIRKLISSCESNPAVFPRLLGAETLRKLLSFSFCKERKDFEGESVSYSFICFMDKR